MARQRVRLEGQGKKLFLGSEDGPIAPLVAAKAGATTPVDALTEFKPTKAAELPRGETTNLVGHIVDLPIVDLWLDDQPRKIVPDAVLERLIAEGTAQPSFLLAELQAIAKEHPYYRGVLAVLQELARTIRSDGVLEPLLVVNKDGHQVLRDGHRRSLASLLAERQTVPVRVVDEASALQAAARQLVVNIQRQDLTALEKGRWLYRLARLVEDDLRAELGVDGPSLIEEFASSSDDSPAEDQADEHQLSTHVRTETPGVRDLSAAIRSRVCEMTGLGRTAYYQFLRLNRLSPEAQEDGIALTEGQLRPVATLPSADQAGIVRFIADRKLTSKEAATLVGVAKSGDRDAVKRVMAKLAREDTTPTRSSVSWEPLLHALPQDLWVRCSSLRAELEALPAERRKVRLHSLGEQRRLATDFLRQIDEIFALYGPADDNHDFVEDAEAV